MRCLTVGLMFLLAAAPVLAQVHKCKNSDGTTSYQQTACAGAQATEKSPMLSREPTLTEADIDRIADEQGESNGSERPTVYAKNDGLSQAQSHGFGTSAYSGGAITAYECTRSDGTIYHAKQCSGSRERIGTRMETVYDTYDSRTGRQISRGDIDNQRSVFDPQSGRFLSGNQVRHQPREEQRAEYGYLVDRVEAVSANTACAAMQGDSTATSKRRARKDPTYATRNYDLCKSGRSLYETPSGPGISQGRNRPSIGGRK